jgi:hypothetical protein
MRSYPINWSLDLASNTITLNIINNPGLGTKIINENNPSAEFHIDNDNKFNAKISADFQIKQLLLNGRVRYRGGMHPAWRSKTYENIVITTW